MLKIVKPVGRKQIENFSNVVRKKFGGTAIWKAKEVL
jgi:hypothetical protein